LKILGFAGATDIPVESVTLDSDDVRFDLRLPGAIYSGRLHRERRVIEGEWRQSGQVIPLVLERAEDTS